MKILIKHLKIIPFEVQTFIYSFTSKQKLRMRVSLHSKTKANPPSSRIYNNITYHIQELAPLAHTFIFTNNIPY